MDSTPKYWIELSTIKEPQGPEDSHRNVLAFQLGEHLLKEDLVRFSHDISPEGQDILRAEVCVEKLEDRSVV